MVSIVVNTTNKADLGNISLSGSAESINLDYSDSSGKLLGNISNSSQLNFTVSPIGGGTPIVVVMANK